MKMTKQEYTEYVKTKSGKSPILKDCFMAFLIGGLICTLGQAIFSFYQSFGFSEKTVSAATSITLIFLSALFTGLDLYPKLAKYAGAGTIVPITGFANAVVSPAIEAKSEGIVLGVGAKIFSIAGPVILFATVSSIVCGLVYFLIGLM